MLRIALGCVLVLVCTFPWANDTEQRLDHRARQLRSVTVQIDEASAALAESEKRLESIASELKSARKQLAKTQRQMNKVLQANTTGTHGAKARNAEHKRAYAAAQFDRDRNKVERLQKRAAATREMIARVDTLLRNLRTKQSQLLDAINGVKHTSNRTAKREKHRSAQTEAEQHTQKAVPVEAAPKSADIEQWPYLSSANEREILYARNRLDPLSRSKAQGFTPKGPLQEVVIVNRHSFGEETMEYLGDNLYSLTKTLHAGRQQFTLFNFDFWHTVPIEDHNTLYRMIFDVSSLSNPKFHLFRESLLVPDAEKPVAP